MFGDWIYYPIALLLLLANLASWAGNFYQLHGNWLIVANSTLVMFLLPPSSTGMGIGWFALCLIVALAILGDSFQYASKRHRIFSRRGSPPVRQRVLVGAGIGSLTCVLAGMTIPVIGSLLAILGAVGGAAGGAWLGAVISPPQSGLETKVDSVTNPILSRFLTEQEIKLIPRLVAGLLMIAIATYSSLL